MNYQLISEKNILLPAEMDEERTYKNLSELIDKLPDNYSILEDEIDINIHIEYQEMSHRLRKKKQTDGSAEALYSVIEELINHKDTEEQIKTALIHLASSGDVKSFQMLKNLEKKLELEPLKSWLKIALLDCEVYLENQLLDTKKYIVITGLGGKGKKLRYCIICFTKEGKTLSELNKNTLEKEFSYSLEQYDGLVEDIQFNEEYLSLLCLIPLREQLEDIIDPIIKECISLGVPLKKGYMITNVKKLDREEINTILKEEKEEESKNYLDTEEDITDE